MTPCPCCGAPMEADSATALARAARMRGEVTPQQLALVEALDAAKGALVSAHALAGKVWADDPNGGPLAVKLWLGRRRSDEDQSPACEGGQTKRLAA